MMQNLIGMHIIVEGKVQGVGFRATVRNYAREHDLQGNVRNLPDGSVEINAQGSQEKLDAFIKFLGAGAGLALGGVTSVSKTLVAYSEGDEGFNVC